jgi:hypothetical protein
MYCRYCRHHCQPQNEPDVMAPLFDVIIWLSVRVAKLIPEPIKRWFKDREGPGTNSQGPQ